MRRSRSPFNVRRLMVVIAASATIFALLDAFQVPPEPACAYGTVSCLAIVGIAYLAKDTRDLCSALTAIACGILFGAPAVQDACSPIGILLDPIVGLIARIATRRRFRNPWGEQVVP